jgi:hypothetical protein
MGKEIKLLLGGEERTLVFKTMTVMKFAGEVVEDPLELLSDDLPPKMLYRRILAFVYSGLKSAGHNFTIEQVDEWVQDMSFPDGAKVVNTVLEAMLGGNGQAGEQKPRTRAKKSA